MTANQTPVPDDFPGSIVISWGDGTDTDTFYTLFQPLIGWVLEINGEDVMLASIGANDDDPIGEIGFNLQPWDDDTGEIRAGFSQGPGWDKRTGKVKFVAWSDIRTIKVH